VLTIRSFRVRQAAWENEVILFHLSFPRFENQVDALSGDEVEWLPDGRQGWTYACRRIDIVETDDR